MIFYSCQKSVFQLCQSIFLLEHVCTWTQHFTKIVQRKRKIETNLHLKPQDYRIYHILNIDLRHQYGIFVAESQTFLHTKRPQLRRARRNGCFRRLDTMISHTFSCPMLQSHRDYLKCMLVFQSLHGLAPAYLLNEFNHMHDFHSYNTCHRDFLCLPLAQTTKSHGSSRFSVAKIWNTFPLAL